MEKMNKDELRTALAEKKLIDETGTVNAITVNYISGLYTWPLLNEVWVIEYFNEYAPHEAKRFHLI